MTTQPSRAEWWREVTLEPFDLPTAIALITCGWKFDLRRIKEVAK